MVFGNTKSASPGKCPMPPWFHNLCKKAVASKATDKGHYEDENASNRIEAHQVALDLFKEPIQDFFDTKEAQFKEGEIKLDPQRKRPKKDFSLIFQRIKRQANISAQALEKVFARILKDLHPEEHKKEMQKEESMHPVKQLLAAIKSGTIRIQNILGLVVSKLAADNKLDLENYRKHLKAGMNFTERLSSLENDSDKEYEPQCEGKILTNTMIGVDYINPNLDQYRVSEKKISFKEDKKNIRLSRARKATMQKIQNGEKRSCPARSLKLNIDINGDGKKTPISLVKASYWLIAKEVERILFRQKGLWDLVGLG